MKASLIIIGDELTSGKTADRNGPFLAQWVRRQGLDLIELKIIGDDREHIGQALREAWERTRLIITSGGLGPTEDDKTRAAVREFVGEELGENPAALAIVKRQYQRFGKTWSPGSNAYHLLPPSCFPVENPGGLAPGWGLAREGKLLLAAPGVPSELQGMAEKEWPSLLAQYFPQQFSQFQRITVRTHGIGEEQLFKIWPSHLRQRAESLGKLSSLPQILGVDLVFSFQGNESEKGQRLVELKNLFRDTPVAPYIWQWGELSLPHFVVQNLKAKKMTLSLAESCTGGLVANLLTDVPGVSGVLHGGVVAYTNPVKISRLAVSPETLQAHGAVSEAVAREMARGAQTAFQTDYTISFTGLAGPDGGTAERPVGTVAIGLACLGQVEAQLYHFRGNRRHLKEIFARQGLFLLLKAMA